MPELTENELAEVTALIYRDSLDIWTLMREKIDARREEMTEYMYGEYFYNFHVNYASNCVAYLLNRGSWDRNETLDHFYRALDAQMEENNKEK